MPVVLRRTARVYMRHETTTVDKVARLTLRLMIAPAFDCVLSSRFSAIFSAEMDYIESKEASKEGSKVDEVAKGS
jgi:hypothetical protein